MEDKLFTSVEEECRHWKERYLKVSQERDDAQREFDDFTSDSRQLEAELEATVEQQEKKIRDLNQMVTQLHSECDSYKRKLQYNENETSKLDCDYRQLANENEKLKVYIRELEQKNDDLERANRVASESVVEFESMLNQAYEKNALLELEVDEKERMQIKLQRLMDEARDLKQELKVRTLKPGENGEEEQGQETAKEQCATSQLANDSNSASGTTGSTQLTNMCLDANGSFSAEPSKLEIVNNNLNATKQRSAPSILAPLAKLAGNKLHDLGSPLREASSEEAKTFGDATKGSPFLPTAATPTGALIIERNGNTTTTSNSMALVPLQATSGGLNPPMAPSDRVSTLNIVADLLRRLDNMEAKLKAWKIRKPSSRTGGGTGNASAAASTGSQRSLYSHNHQHHAHHHAHHPSSHQQGQPSSYQSHHHHNSGSNHSLNSLVSDGTTGASGALSGSIANCCGSSSSNMGNVQLHSYQPSTITIGTQTSQQATVAAPAKTELLLRTSK
ncbi:nuclear distribution protein nudE homolog [Anopheles darlingi]|uniref:nuclear distribution protein nudE homolog n=1 Tax=Anopheles darlingi TaxID=43151 RepID=UPI0021003F42|nr:nuclear distribution protein nudE homolog [Anopheles darlingi]